jgi:hypothetical protein
MCRLGVRGQRHSGRPIPTLAAPVSTVYRAIHDLGHVKVKGRL